MTNDLIMFVLRNKKWDALPFLQYIWYVPKLSCSIIHTPTNPHYIGHLQEIWSISHSHAICRKFWSISHSHAICRMFDFNHIIRLQFQLFIWSVLSMIMSEIPHKIMLHIIKEMCLGSHAGFITFTVTNKQYMLMLENIKLIIHQVLSYLWTIHTLN